MLLSEKLPMNGSLDPVDLKILKLLSQDSKMPYAELGKRANLTAPAIHARVKKMEKLGIIKRYQIEIDYEKVGLPVTAFIRLQVNNVSCSEVGKKLIDFPEVEECHATAGEDDLLLKVRTATPLELQNLLDKMKAAGLSDKSVSVFVLQTHFERPRVC